MSLYAASWRDHLSWHLNIKTTEWLSTQLICHSPAHPEYSTGIETVLGVCVNPLITPCECVMCFMDFGIFSSPLSPCTRVFPQMFWAKIVFWWTLSFCVFLLCCHGNRVHNTLFPHTKIICPLTYVNTAGPQVTLSFLSSSLRSL